jgi:hypothetical protein
MIRFELSKIKLSDYTRVKDEEPRILMGPKTRDQGALQY